MEQPQPQPQPQPQSQSSMPLTPADLRNIWNQIVNRPKVTDDCVTRAIKNFWEYAKSHIHNINIKQLKTHDMPIIDARPEESWHDYHMLLSPSGVAYSALSDLFSKIVDAAKASTSLSFFMTLDRFPLNLHDKALKAGGDKLLNKLIYKGYKQCGTTLDQKKIPDYEVVLNRYLLVLTCTGNIKEVPLVERIYEISLNYTFNEDWQVIKYTPALFRLDSEDIPTFQLQTGTPRTIPLETVKYYYFDKQVLIATQESYNQQELEFMCMSAIQMMGLLFGEFTLMHNFQKINMTREQDVDQFRPLAAANLKPIAEFFTNVQPTVFGNSRLCQFCNLRDFNCTFKTIDHNLFNEGHEDYLPEGDYCSYCIDCVDRIFMSS
jgi:hypothetical protein